MKKISLIILLIVAAYLCLGFACKKSVGSGGGSAGGEWEFVRSVSSTHIVLPINRPQEQRSIKQVRVFSDVPLSQKWLDIVDEGIANQLRRSSKDNPNMTPANAWLNWKSFDSHDDYSVIFVRPDYISQEGETKGCRLICVGAGCAMTAIGTNAGVQIVNGIPRAPGGLYLVIARQDFDESNPAPENPQICDALVRNGVDYESEHARLMDQPDAWFYYQGINDYHPIFSDASNSAVIRGPSPVSGKPIDLTEKEIQRLLKTK